MPRSTEDAGWRLDNTYSRLPAPFFDHARPAAVPAPAVVIFNRPLAAELGFDPRSLHEDAAAIFSGNELPPGAEPIAQAYAGHQFGHFTNLGDGRAILLGEQLTPGARRVDIQLKGAGRTRYSRGGDGRAALGPMLREYIISEGMHALGVPTTRSLAVTATGATVLRETPLPGAVLTRVAASHMRVGTFQYAAAMGERGLGEALLQYAIARHAPEAAAADDPALAFLEDVVDRQAALVARWMLLGFVHGVMNTDNMAVSGETIDYGPCAFLDTYDPATVFSSIDRQGRYAFGNQPAIAHWNLARLAECLLPLVQGAEDTALDKIRGVLDTFPERFARHHLTGARAKLGLVTALDRDRHLFDDLLDRMRETRADFTDTFAGLAATAESGTLPAAVAGDAGMRSWHTAWVDRLSREPAPRADAVARMRCSNPVVIPRNHRVEEALAAAEAGDLSVLERLLTALREPYMETADNEPYRTAPPAGCGTYRTFCGT
ncbi:MAG: YdiU family protein [Planctomycetia bacterium]|nr:YdiU family protein [Planctomycetia bacterium]